jgi:hypothetical protein
MDTAWLTDPRTYFTGDYDMWAGHDGPIRYCTGFLAPKLSSAITGDGNKHTDVVVVHNNFIEGHDEKVERFKKAELWRTN